jgi:hypothetical protein
MLGNIVITTENPLAPLQDLNKSNHNPDSIYFHFPVVVLNSLYEINEANLLKWID